MAEYSRLVGGFAGANAKDGLIVESYSVMKLKATSMEVAGFCSKNEGRIRDSISEKTGKKYQAGFSIHDAVDSWKSCHYLHNLSEKNVENFKDAKVSVKVQDFDLAVAKSLGYDMEKIWAFDEEKKLLSFKEETWLYAVSEKENTVHISDVDSFLEFASKVNEGDENWISKNIILDTDLDLKGKNFTPIGAERKNAYKGVFDGRGHVIKNLKVNDKSLAVRGLFGYLKGFVINTTVDLYSSGDGIVGPVAAVNEGNIAYCGSASEINFSDQESVVGGLVGINYGKIIRSYAAGKIQGLMIPLPVLSSLFLLLGFALLMIELVGVAIPRMKITDTIYAPLPEAKDQVKIEEEPETPSEEMSEDIQYNVIAFGFDETIVVNRNLGTCEVHFTNPSSSTNKLLLELSITAANGEPEIIATCDAVRPGYGVDTMTLFPEKKSSLVPGTYEGMMCLYAYDEATNSKSMVETSLPITLEIK